MTDADYIRECYRHAAEYSQDLSTQNAAALVDYGGKIVARGANNYPAGVRVIDERERRPLKYAFIEHAERNVIYLAARVGIKTYGLTMYCPWFACSDCARAIIQAGVGEVVGHDFELHRSRPDWAESIKNAMTMLAEAGVKTRYVSGHVGGCRILFDGKWVEP
jgi:dCMP deaminase